MEAKYNHGLEFYLRTYIANQSFRNRALVCREGSSRNAPPTNTVKFRKKSLSVYKPLQLVRQKTLR